MFDEGYKFREVNHVKGKTVNEPFLKEYRFTFRGKNKCEYMVRVQEYSYHFFAIKFHLNSHQHRADRYEVLTDYHDATRIIRTCVEIMLYIYEKNPYSSFGFIGNNSKGENNENTKRFRVYKQVMENFFSPEKFYHFRYENMSAYLLINKDNSTPNLFEKIKEELLTIFNKP